ncbi:MAG: sulfotransferase domain-containing protein [Acidimicrobiales bacterium]
MDLRRPTDIADVTDRLENFRSPDAADAVAHFVARPSDVFICTYSKSGTTWMQQILHQLRSGSSMDFDEISVVVPWLETAFDVGIDPHADQQWRPRVFKTHLTRSEAPDGGRYVTVFRDPLTVLPSFHRFFDGWWFESGSISLAEFARGLYMRGSQAGSHWNHLVDWWPHIESADVLAFSYEDMVAAPDRVPAVVAEFLGFDLSDEELAAATHNSSRAVMLEHASKFEEQVLREHRDHLWGLPPGGDASKVVAATSVEIDDDLRAELDQMWMDTVGAELGFENYDAFRRALPDPLGVRS